MTPADNYTAYMPAVYVHTYKVTRHTVLRQDEFQTPLKAELFQY